MTAGDDLQAYHADMTTLILVAVISLFLLGLVGLRAPLGPFPDTLELGGITVEFSVVDRFSYLVAIVAIAVGVVSGLVSIWSPAGALFGRLGASAALLFVGSVLTLLLNRLMRGRETPRG